MGILLSCCWGEAATEEGVDVKFGVNIFSSQHGKGWQNLSLGTTQLFHKLCGSLEILYLGEAESKKRFCQKTEMLLLFPPHTISS